MITITITIRQREDHYVAIHDDVNGVNPTVTEMQYKDAIQPKLKHILQTIEIGELIHSEECDRDKADQIEDILINIHKSGRK